MSLREKEVLLKLDIIKKQVEDFVNQYNKLSSDIELGATMHITTENIHDPSEDNNWYSSQESCEWHTSEWCGYANKSQ